MAEWVYDPEDWVRTRSVDVAGVTDDGGSAVPDADGYYRWHRSRVPGGKVVAISGGYAEVKWAYRSAVKENIGLDVPVPEGVVEMEVDDGYGEPGDAPIEPDVPPQP